MTAVFNEKEASATNMNQGPRGLHTGNPVPTHPPFSLIPTGFQRLSVIRVRRRNDHHKNKRVLSSLTLVCMFGIPPPWLYFTASCHWGLEPQPPRFSSCFLRLGRHGGTASPVCFTQNNTWDQKRRGRTRVQKVEAELKLSVTSLNYTQYHIHFMYTKH